MAEKLTITMKSNLSEKHNNQSFELFPAVFSENCWSRSEGKNPDNRWAIDDGEIAPLFFSPLRFGVVRNDSGEFVVKNIGLDLLTFSELKDLRRWLSEYIPDAIMGNLGDDFSVYESLNSALIGVEEMIVKLQ